MAYGVRNFLRIVHATLVGSVLVSINSFAQPSNMGYLFKYKNIGVRNMAASYAPYAPQALQNLGNRFNFVTPSGSGQDAPYYNEATKTGDVAFLEGNFGNVPWVAVTDAFNEINGIYLYCTDPITGQVISNNCDTINKKALFALIRFNNDNVNTIWNNYVDKNQVINGHLITINDVRQHLIAHEFGHVIGMGHEGDTCEVPQQAIPSTSVMQAGIWCKPFFTGYTSSDVAWFSVRY